MTKRSIAASILFFATLVLNAQRGRHTFELGTSDFLLDKKPFQIISGEMHPARIPVEYWRHRIQMAKAMGCNTISIYIFWNYHETEEGIFDFETGNRNLAEFFRLVQEEQMWLIVRPGPYVCAEWELGGIPPYLLRIPDINLRSMDARYMAAAERYIARLSDVLEPYMVTKGGPLLMIQVENEYGSYGNDRRYMERIREQWAANGINIPTFTGDGPTVRMLEAGTLPGSAVGLDSGKSQADFELAAGVNPGVPVFSSETYTGWLTHWGEQWAKGDTAQLLKEVKFLMDNKKSFNLYVIHGGTNFGYTAGANSGGKGYEPDITSYDYDAPITEQGLPTEKYMALRRLISSYSPKEKLPPVPAPIPAFEIPAIGLMPFNSVWNILPEPVNTEKPQPFEYYGQDYGFMIYKTTLPNSNGGKLTVNGLHDYATVFINGHCIGKIDRRLGENSIDIPATGEEKPVLEILAEAMGRINYGQQIVDRKGITGDVTLNGILLLNWQAYRMPMDSKTIYDLRSTGKNLDRPGVIFRGNFMLLDNGDTFIDMSNYEKGIVWVNGHNLGRYWNTGPQKRLFCPAVWLRKSLNEIIIFDLHQTTPKPVFGFKTIN
ncbi:MAG: beta-galactosidase [Bacteroidales bacterium]|jgi:beta-galactosidase|nr:beta-galactosidase [Bacteroidales bacterium]